MKMRISEKVVLRVVGKTVIPYVLLFGLYVQVHGDFGPGGGFQAGVIVAAGFILYALVFGLEPLQKIVSPTAVETGITLGVGLYAGVGIASLLLGGNFLDYNVLLHDPIHGQHLGIFLVELGVGITVWSVMLAIYYGFAGWKPSR
jgi:multicomponent Na+:H+ antiporter subunit B